MGNINSACCLRKRRQRERRERRERLKPENPKTALETIREAQRKYFNTHIESMLDESCDEESRDDSIDMTFGSEMSLDALDDGGMSNNGSIHECLNYSTENGHTSALLHNVLVNGVTGKHGMEAEVVLKKKVPKRKPKAKFIRLNKRDNFFSILNMEDKKARSVDPKMYDYPFENIVFEGGGNKGLAYCGAVRLMEELGLWPQIKRLSGTSAGAMTAALLAVGYNSFDLQTFFSLNLNKIFLDHKFGYLSLLPNLLTSYGWNPGRKIYSWFGQKLQEKTGNGDITFKQLYQQTGRELCIVATNLNQMTSLYCHPKTTPDMPIRLAVRMSISIPGMFQAVKHTLHGHTDVFVDGGVLCNYPIHCFDGWWLSMKSEDNYLERLQPLEDIPRLLERTERFGSYNEKTLGMQLYSDNEQDLLKYQLENLRHGTQLQELPNTKLAREKIKKKKLQLKTDREHRRLVKAMNAFLLTLRKHNKNKDENIDREELEAALNDQESFHARKRLILFGDVDSDIILDYLDRDHNGKISYDELVHFMEETGICMQNRFLGYQRRNISTFPMFLDTLQATLLTNVKRVYVEERDLKRTVGINTGHIGTSDFVLEPEDIEFVIERGRRSLEAFLKYYVASNHMKKKPAYRKLKKDLRQDSQASFTSSNDSSTEVGHLFTSAVSPGTETVPSTSTSCSKGKKNGDDCEVSTCGKDNEPTQSIKLIKAPTKSQSSGRSVSISDKIKIIEHIDNEVDDDEEDHDHDNEDDDGVSEDDDPCDDDGFEDEDCHHHVESDEGDVCEDEPLIREKESSVQSGGDVAGNITIEIQNRDANPAECSVPLLRLEQGESEVVAETNS